MSFKLLCDGLLLGVNVCLHASVCIFDLVCMFLCVLLRCCLCYLFIFAYVVCICVGFVLYLIMFYMFVLFGCTPLRICLRIFVNCITGMCLACLYIHMQLSEQRPH